MLSSAFTLAFASYLRVGEYTTRQRRSLDPVRTLTPYCVTGKQLFLSLPRTKNCQHGSTVANVGTTTCPVTAMRRYLQSQKGSPSQPLFMFQDGRHLTPVDVNNWLRKHLGPGYTSQSLRIGVATSAREQGVPEHIIQQQGR